MCSAGIFGCEREAAVLAVCNMLRDACCACMQGAAHNRHNMQQTTSHMRCATANMQQKDSIPQATCTIRQATCKMQSAAQYIVQHSTLCDVRHTTITMLWQLLPPPHLHWIPFIMCPTTTRTRGEVKPSVSMCSRESGWGRLSCTIAAGCHGLLAVRYGTRQRTASTFQGCTLPYILQQYSVGCLLLPPALAHQWHVSMCPCPCPCVGLVSVDDRGGRIHLRFATMTS